MASFILISPLLPIQNSELEAVAKVKQSSVEREMVPLLALRLEPPATDTSWRYFYVLHRPSDWSSPSPDGTRKIIESGGVTPGGLLKTKEDIEIEKQIYKMRGQPYPSKFRKDGMHRSVVSFLKSSFHPQKGADSTTYKSMLAWYYLNNYQGSNVLSFANENELVFRVPESWLIENALSCLEHVPMMSDTKNTIAPFAFLTALVVPLEHRIVDPTPLTGENTRVMSTLEVRNLLFHAHMFVDPQLRCVAHYDHVNRVQDDEKERSAETPTPSFPINPFM